MLISSGKSNKIEDRLNACQSCGSKAKHYKQKLHSIWHHIICSNDFCGRSVIGYKNINEAIDSWNNGSKEKNVRKLVNEIIERCK